MDPASFYEVMRRDFRAFNRKCFEILNPTTPFHDNWRLDAIGQCLMDLHDGKCRRQIITMPPRSLKSTSVSVAWTAWVLGRDPHAKIIVASYAETLAEKLSSDTRRIMESDFYRLTFPGTRLEKATKLYLETTAGGSRHATSVGGSITGFGADWIILDDPHNASEAYSPSAREAVKRYHSQTLLTRFNNATDGKMVLVMQRLHADDLVGHLLSLGGWNHLKLQARATEDCVINVGRASPHLVKTGDLLDPVLFPQSALDHLQIAMGSANFLAQYQQDPVPETGNMIKAAWLQRYTEAPSRVDCKVTLSVDTATKTDPANDYSACAALLEKDGSHYLIGLWRDRVDFPGLRKKLIELRDVWDASTLLIEDQGAGASLIQELTNLGIPAIGRKARDSKEARLSAASSYIEAGMLLLPTDAPWLAEFEAELLGFPNTRHDDQVDCISQYFAWVRERPKAGVFEYEFIGGPESPSAPSGEAILAMAGRR